MNLVIPQNVIEFVIFPFLTNKELCVLGSCCKLFRACQQSKFHRRAVQLWGKKCGYPEMLFYVQQINRFPTRLVCKSDVILIFRITESSLLSTQVKNNPPFAAKKLYSLSRVMRLCFARHGNVQGLINYKNELQQRIVRKEEKRKAEEKKNQCILVEALAKNGLTLRDDSYFCQSFISGKNKDLSLVVRKMQEAKYLYEYCGFDKHYEQITNRIKHNGYYHWMS